MWNHQQEIVLISTRVEKAFAARFFGTKHFGSYAQVKMVIPKYSEYTRMSAFRAHRDVSDFAFLLAFIL